MTTDSARLALAAVSGWSMMSPVDGNRTLAIQSELSAGVRSSLSAFVLLVVVSLPALASADQLRVRGVPTFRAVQTQPTADGGYRVIGYVRDAFDQPLDGLRVELDASEGQPCEPGSDQSGTDGEFCFRVRGATGEQVHLAVAPTELLDAASEYVRLDPTASTLKLSLELPGKELLLDQPAHSLTVALDSGAGGEPYPVKLRLEHGKNAQITLQRTLTVSALKSATVELPSEQLGAAGQARLVAEVAIAEHVLAHTERAITIVDTVGVALAEELGAVRPVQGFEVKVVAQGHAGPASSGWVEVRVGQTHVGSAQVHDGRATVEVRFQASRRERLPLLVRYVPEQPWYRAGEELETTIEVLPLPLWAHAPWIILAAVASYWIIRAWRRPGRRREATASRSDGPARAEAVLVRRSRGATAWTGLVADAHTRQPIPGARLSIELPAVHTIEVASRSESDAEGRFELGAVRNVPEAARLVVRAEHHSELRQAVPALGELQISLVERRRNLLLGLTRWAKEMGWGGAAEPTPAHVADMAMERDRDATRLWARDIEQAAYGPAPPGEETEQRLASATPPLDRPSAHKR